MIDPVADYENPVGEQLPEETVQELAAVDFVKSLWTVIFGIDSSV